MADTLVNTDLGALRLRLSKITDTALRAYGRSLIGQCRPEKRRTPPMSELELLLTEIQDEWRRRHPVKQKISNRLPPLTRKLSPHQ
jgi:hypothetical protein